MKVLDSCGLSDRAPEWDYHQFFPPGWIGADIDKEVR